MKNIDHIFDFYFRNYFRIAKYIITQIDHRADAPFHYNRFMIGSNKLFTETYTTSHRCMAFNKAVGSSMQSTVPYSHTFKG